MVAFTDSQVRTVWVAADRVPFEKRGIFIERVAQWRAGPIKAQKAATDNARAKLKRATWRMSRLSRMRANAASPVPIWTTRFVQH